MPITDEQRLTWEEICPSFGRDPEDGSPGFDGETVECQKCASSDPVMAEACVAECEAEWKKDVSTGPVEEVPAEAPVAPTAAPQEEAQAEEPVETPAKVEESEAKPEQKGAPVTEEKKAPVEKKVSRTDVFWELLADATPRTKKEFAEAIATKLEKFTVKQLMGYVGDHLRFSVGAGFMVKDADGKYMKV